MRRVADEPPKKEKGGFFKALDGDWPQPQHYQAIVERAERLWSEGKSTFVYRQQATSHLNEDGLTEVLDRIVAIGWRLHSTALSFNKVALNTEVALFVFVR
ncbi:MAG TPA: hypothetical protein VNT56_09250 [Acidimicrobiales bacterium]|nr:hypothetical protein [Acidimicrobiales bacterium]